MDGVHDLGGLQGFGPVDVEPDEPVFHADWERRAMQIMFAVTMIGWQNGGRFRHSIERMDPAHYLSSSYYEHWLTGVATNVVERGAVGLDELEERAGGAFPLARPERPGAMPSPPSRRFAVGDRVRVRNWHPTGHTRCPRYVQGKRGTVVRVDVIASLPDIEAHSDDRREEQTYCVRFDARELWGDGDGLLHVDLWESYLEEDG